MTIKFERAPQLRTGPVAVGPAPAPRGPLARRVRNLASGSLLLALGLGLVACSDKGGAGSAPGTAASGAASQAASAAGSAATASAKGPASAAAPHAAGSGAAEAPAIELPPGPIAKVNGVEVDREEFVSKYTKMTKAFTTRSKEIPEGLATRYKQSILKQLVDKELLAQEIKKQNISVTEEAMATEYADYKKMFRTDENYERYLKTSGTTEEAIKENIQHNLAVNRLLEEKGGLKVAEAEVKKYYDDNLSRYEIKEQVRASHILVKVAQGADKKTEDEAKKKAEQIYKDATKPGADFAELAKKHSEGPTAPRGGDLSYFQRGRMVPEFDAVVFDMKVNDISKPVRTQFGWHVIQLTDKKEGRQRPYDEVRESIEKLLINKNSRQAKAEMLKKLKDAAKIEVLIPGLDLEPAPLSPEADGTPGANLKVAPTSAAPKAP